MFDNEKTYIIDEAKNFRIKFTKKLQHLEFDIISYESSTQSFSRNFIKLLKVISSDKFLTINSLPFCIELSKEQRTIILLGDEEFSTILFDNEIISIKKNFRKLTVFETRMIARYTGDYFPKKVQLLNNLTTDLHTHLSGQVDSKSLIKIGLKHDVLYPTAYLDKLNIQYDSQNLKYIESKPFLPLSHFQETNHTQSAISLNNLTPSQLKTLEYALSLSPEAQSTFEDIEHCYQFREPFTKNIDLLEMIFESIAKDYNSNHIKYAELSSNSVIDELWLHKIETILPAIEKKYSIDFRFLVGIPRNLSKEKLIARIEKIKRIYNNKYIVGIDLLGYEISKTADHEEQLEILANYIKYRRPEFIFRIHAGENSKNPANVKEALFFAIENKVKIRIGHSIYGIDKEAIELAQKLSKENLLTIEFNPDSNLASNNIDFPEDVPIKKFIEAGIKTVISSDGAGLYQTSSKQLYIVGKICGLDDHHFNIIKQTENEYINSILNPSSSNQAVQTSIKFDHNDLRNKIPILIAGAKGSSWLDISSSGKKKIKKLFRDLMYNLDPNKFFFITGRSKDKGIAIELGKEILLYNFVHNKKYAFISSVSEREDGNFKKPQGISHIQDSPTPLVYLPSEMIAYIKKNNGIAIFLGGKSFTRDFIVEAYKQNVKFALMNNIKGASKDKARIYKEHSFSSFDELNNILFKNLYI